MRDLGLPDTRRRMVHGVSIGILMLRTHFTRYPGDIGNAATWNFPVSYRIVHDADPSNITTLHATDLLEPFKRAAASLIEEGVDGITTTCGFLSLYQKELADFCGVPVATSSLLQVPMAQRLIAADKQVGIITFDGDALGGPYLEAVGVDPDTPVIGMPGDSDFVRWIAEDDNTVPFERLREDAVDTALRLVSGNPEIGAIVCECTNLAPFSADIAAALDLPVFDCVSLVNWFHAGLRPRRFPTEVS